MKRIVQNCDLRSKLRAEVLLQQTGERTCSPATRRAPAAMPIGACAASCARARPCTTSTTRTDPSHPDGGAQPTSAARSSALSRRSALLPGPPRGPHGPVTLLPAHSRSSRRGPQLSVRRQEQIGQGHGGKGCGAHRPRRPRRRGHPAEPLLTTAPHQIATCVLSLCVSTTRGHRARRRLDRYQRQGSAPGLLLGAE